MAQEQILEGFHLSPQQKRLLKEQRRDLDLVSQVVVRLEGPAEPSRLREAILETCRRHEILRTRFERLPGMEIPLQVVGDEPRFVWAERAPKPGGGLVGLEWAMEVAREERASIAGRIVALAPLREDAGTALRCVFADGGGGAGFLILTLPSIVADGQSLEVLLDELTQLYGGTSPGEPLQYLQFSEWLNELLEDPESERGRQFWSEWVGVEREPVRLPWQVSEPSEEGLDQAWLRHRFELSGMLVERAREVAAEAGCDLRELLLAVWGSLLGRLADAPAVVVELGTDGRRFAELRDAVGPFAIDLPVAVQPPVDRPFIDELRRLGDWLREVAEWSELALALDDGAGGGFGFELEEARPARDSAGMGLEIVEKYHARRRLGLRCVATPRDGGLALELQADPAVYDWLELGRLGRYFGILAAAVLEHPERSLRGVELIDREESATLARWNATEMPRRGPEQLVSAFASQAAATPDRIAVRGPDGYLSFRELSRRADLLAGHLRRSGVVAESRVGVFLERSVAQMVAVWGILRAGAAYVPLDTFQPAARLRSILDDAGAKVVVSEIPLRECWPGDGFTTVAIDGDWSRIETGPPSPAVSAPNPRNLAYVLYTSGSTGRPKGVLVEHRSVMHLSRALARGPYTELEGERALRVAVNAPLAFDASVKQIIQLLRGHTLVVVPEEIRTDGEVFASWLERRAPDVLDVTPSHLRLLVAAGLVSEESGASAPRAFLIGGEAVDRELWQTLARDGGRESFNLYGPTECTVDASASAVSAEAETSIGRPLTNVRLWVFDRWLARVPVGVAGELCVAGDGVARGYLGRPARTAASFVPDPFASGPGERLYRTGDRVRLLPDGRVEFLGRLDRQIKLRGVRLELGELESALHSSPKVLEALAHVRDFQGEPQLVAYAVPRRRYAAAVDGRPRHDLPNGLSVVQQNRNETDYLYQEIFEKRCYLQHGISLPDDACVLDVGANIGMFSLQVLQECARPRIFAFEPLPPLLETLRLNVDLYGPAGRVKTYGFGLSDVPRVERFTFYPRYTMMSGASAFAQPEAEVEVVKRFLENQRRSGDEDAVELIRQAEELLAGRFAGEQAECELRRLSDVLAELGIEHVDLLKIDVQRAELEVLRGIDEEDWSRIDQVVLEVHDAVGEATEGRTREISALLERRGFTAVVEQDELLIGTDRYNLYAARPASCRRPAASGAGAAAGGAVRGPAEGMLTVDELRELLRREVPEYMMPAAVVLLEDFPLNRNGKIDFAALPAPEEVSSAGTEDAAPPRTPHEEVLVGIWSEVLGADRPGVDRSFFELGGHSLLATQLMSRIREVFEVELPLRTLFELPTIEGLAERIERAVEAGERPLAPPLERRPYDGERPVSFAEQRLWFLHQLNPRSAAYNSPKALQLDGALNPARLFATIDEIVRRHEILRTHFPAVDGLPVARIAPPGQVPLPLIDLSVLSEEDRQASVRRLLAGETRTPFELDEGPLMRLRLLRLANAEHVFLLTMHHIVTDAWSLGVLVREVASLYRSLLQGKPSPLPELPVQYGDYACWQREWLSGDSLEHYLDFWRRQLGGQPPELALPTDRPRPAAPSGRGARRTFLLPTEMVAEIEAMSSREGVTVFMALYAVFVLLLSRYCRQQELVVGVPIAGRNRRETEDLIGFFINILLMRFDLTSIRTYRDLLQQVRRTTLDAYAHQDLPLEKVIEELQASRGGSEAALARVTVGFQNVPRENLDLPGLRLRTLVPELEAVRHDLTLWLSESGGSIQAAWTYSSELFDESTVVRMHEHFELLLRQVVQRPEIDLDALEMFTDAEKEAREEQKKSLKEAGRRRFLSSKVKRPGPVEAGRRG